MQEESYRTGVYSRIKYNAGLLTVKLAAAAIGMFPDRSLMVGLLSLPYGMLIMIRGISRWRGIARFAEVTGSGLHSWFFVPCFFVREAENLLWSIALYETDGAIKKHVEFEGMGLVRAALDGGKGALILGAHYGPPAFLRLLHEKGIQARALASRRTMDHLKASSMSGIPALRSKRLDFLTAPGRLIQSRRSEKELARHVIGGGAAFILSDQPAHSAGGETVEFLGSPYRFNTFAFRLAARHGLPVFILFIRRKSRNSFVLSLKRCEDFGNPIEGLKMYVSELESTIESDPSAWTYLWKYCRWLDQMSNNQ